MLKQLWITGILVAFSVFGIKVGLGLGVHMYNRRRPCSKKMLFFGASLLVYLTLFLGMYGLITSFNLLNYLDQFVNMLRYGMALHLAVALGMFFWGARLILQNPMTHYHVPLRASLLLILPCPVCATVILLNLTLALSLFTLSPLATTLVLFSLFGLIIVTTAGILFPFRQKIGNGNSFLGLSMLLIALYFLLTVIIAPIYPEIKAAFQMAASNSPVNATEPFHTVLLVAVALVFAGTGFIRTYFSKGYFK